MAVGWMTVLKNVPWDVVLAKAPEVADTAKKLWNSVGRQQAADVPAAPAAQTAPAADNPMVELAARLEVAEHAVADLRAQMTACTGLVAQLAEQNSMLAARAAVVQRRMFQLATVAGIALILALAAVVVAVRATGG